MTIAPYGTWTSPISADELAGASHPVTGAVTVGDEVWWLEARPSEDGRSAVRRVGADGQSEDVLPAPWNVRTRVHEYGGGAWTVTPRGALVFAEFSDQRLYRLDAPGGTPVPLTPEPPQSAAWRYGELRFGGGEVWCVRERHDDGVVTRDIAAVPIEGGEPRSVVGGSHFLAGYRVSPDVSSLAWIAWEHPQMPWDGTELRVADLVDGRAENVRTILGSSTESVLQPEWLDNDTLLVSSDRSGYWNLYRVATSGGEPEPLTSGDADVGGPLWSLGTRWFARHGDDVIFVRTLGVDTLCRLDLRTNELSEFDPGEHTSVQLVEVRDDHALLLTYGARVPNGLRRMDLRTGALKDVRLGASGLPSHEIFSPAYATTFHGADGRDVHAVVYPPHSPDFAAPEGELPPYIAFVHGGPTAHVAPMLGMGVAYYTSRGIGVVDVNYGGSSGYGREYRNRLRGQWGVVDVDDTVAAARGLADAGLADPARLGIEGGSAGGWTVLSALTNTDAFACGVSYFGVAELVQFASETHDFESRYLDGLIGPLPEARELYDTRAPVNNVDGLSCPVLLLQGLDDPIVPPSQSERFRDAMIANGLPYAYRTYEGESHGFRRRETIVDAREASLSFYGQVFGFVPPGVAELPLERP